MKKDIAFVVVLILLVVFSAYQAVEISALKESAPVTGAVVGTGKTLTKSPGSSGVSLPDNLKDLDTMVGGC
jgi:hypothetical protein